MHQLPTLYSLTSKNQIQVWRIETNNNRFKTVEGIKGGAMTESAWTTCNGKNLGKANETSPEAQAEKEAKAKWQKKLDSGYWENEADIHKSKFFEPMLAHKWTDYADTPFPLLCGNKIDGVRCIVTKDGMFSRNGKKYVSAPHVHEALKEALDSGVIFDGELYNHKFKNDFNKIVSLVKKTKPTPEDLAESAVNVEFHIFDLIIPSMGDRTFATRYEDLKQFFREFKPSPCIKIVENREVNSSQDVEAALQKSLEDGYEGIMLRVPHSIYENKRSRSLLKYKEFCDEEFEILEVIEGKGGREGKMGRILFKMKDGKTFEANARGNDEFYKQLFLDKAAVCGKMATVRYQNLTPDGIPRFPVCVCIRDHD